MPRYFDMARKSPVMMAQTVCSPRSIGPVSQQPLRKKPVTGAVEQETSAVPSTFTEGSLGAAGMAGSFRRGAVCPVSRGGDRGEKVA